MRNVRKDGHQTKVSLHPSKCGQIFDETFQDLERSGHRHGSSSVGAFVAMRVKSDHKAPVSRGTELPKNGMYSVQSQSIIIRTYA